MRGGTVGYMLPPLNPRTLPVQPGDTLVLASDGIRHGFKHEVMLARDRHSRSPIRCSPTVAKTTDDSCVVVARLR